MRELLVMGCDYVAADDLELIALPHQVYGVNAQADALVVSGKGLKTGNP
jgi:hypothetical protein